MITKKSSKMLVKPEPLPISEQPPIAPTSSPASGNTFVIGSQSPPWLSYEESKVLAKHKRGMVGVAFKVKYEQEKNTESFEFCRQAYLKARRYRWWKRLLEFVRQKLHL